MGRRKAKRLKSLQSRLAEQLPATSARQQRSEEIFLSRVREAIERDRLLREWEARSYVSRVRTRTLAWLKSVHLISSRRPSSG
jgi:hypothetical protein